METKLLTLFNALNEQDRATLLAFAEFLHSRGDAPIADIPTDSPPVAQQAAGLPEPADIPRPEEERVIAALKRLSQTYHMLDKSKMLNATSEIMTQHILQQREAVEVIDELEVIFRSQYDALKDSQQGD